MIRLTLLYLFCFGVAVYAWGDWYKSLCGLILLMAVIEHPDMPKTMFGIQGLNPWNILLLIVVLSWAWSRGREGLSWDLPRHIVVLLLLYLLVMLASFARLIADPRVTGADSTASLVSEYLVNTVKWVVPGLLLFDGCRSRSRFRLAVLTLLGVYFLLGIQVIRWIPPGTALSGQDLGVRALKILVNEVGFHRVNLSMMLSGASWAMLAIAVLYSGPKRALVYAGFLVLVYAQALTAGRMGYVTWALVGFILAVIRWRRALLLIPLVILLVFVAVPGVEERLEQGFDPGRARGPAYTEAQEFDATGPDIYTVTAGRNIAWHFVVQKIEEQPILGYGRLAMQRTGLSRMLLEEFNEEFAHPHNAYLEMLLDNGVVGFLLVVPFYLVILRHAVSLFRDTSDPLYEAAGGVACALLLALLVASLGSQTFYPREGSVPMWCAIGLLLRVYVERSRGTTLEETQDKEPEEVMFWMRPA